MLEENQPANIAHHHDPLTMVTIDRSSAATIEPSSPPQHSYWGNDVESILESLRWNSVLLSNEHKRQYVSLKNVLKYFRLPVIIISACNSVISVSAQPYLSQSYISILTCVLALICGIIGSIELYFAIQVKMETELTASKDYYILATDIFKMLNLLPENRNIDGRSFLDQCYSQYIKLTESSCLVSRKIEDKMTFVGTVTARKKIPTLHNAPSQPLFPSPIQTVTRHHIPPSSVRNSIVNQRFAHIPPPLQTQQHITITPLHHQV